MPDRKNFAEFGFPGADGDINIRGRQYIVEYQEPEKQSERKITKMEIIENYRQAFTTSAPRCCATTGRTREPVGAVG